MLRSDKVVLLVFVFGWLIIGVIGILLFATQFFGWRFFTPTITSLPPGTQTIVVFPDTLPAGYRYLSWSADSASLEHQSDGQTISIRPYDVKPSEDIAKLTNSGVLNDLVKIPYYQLSIRSRGEEHIAGNAASFVIGQHQLTENQTVDAFIAALPDRAHRRFIIIYGKQPAGNYNLAATRTLLNSIKLPEQSTTH